MSSRGGLFDSEFNKKSLYDPEASRKGIVDADFSTDSTAVVEDDGGSGAYLTGAVRVAATAVLLSLAVTTFGYADELPSVPVPDDDGYSVALQKVTPPPLQAFTQAFGWTASDELPTSIVQAAFEDDHHPLVSLRAPIQAFVQWGDDDLPRITTFEDDAPPASPSLRAAVPVSPWTGDDDLPVASVVTVVEEDYWQPPFSSRVPPVTLATGDDDVVPPPQVQVFADESWDAPRTVTPAPILALWDHSDEVPVLVPTDGEWTPLLDQRIDRPANLTLWTQPEEWPTPVPASAVPTESEWTPLVADRLQAPPDLRLWVFADELPTATVPEDSAWAPPLWLQRTTQWLADAPDDLPVAVVLSLHEQEFTPLLDVRIERSSGAPRLWSIPDDLPNSSGPPPPPTGVALVLADAAVTLIDVSDGAVTTLAVTDVLLFSA